MAKYTPEQIQKANQLYREGKTLRYIGKALGVSHDNMKRYIKDYTPPGKVNYAEYADEILELYESGLTIHEVAREIGISHGNVVKYLPLGFANRQLKMMPNRSTEDRLFDEDACDPDVLEYLTLRAVDEEDYTTCLKRLCGRYGMCQKDALATYWGWRHDYVRRLLKDDQEEAFGELESDLLTGIIE